jgi:hypothetical protein
VEELAIEPFYPATAAGAALRSNLPVLTFPASSRCTELNPPPRRPLLQPAVQHDLQ